ncbi:MAG: F0F1 ATP synthase subunit alpha, partial [Candidatus Aminicenantaceae bacterium]
LDKASQAQLDRGERLTEILKQDQYAPLDVVQQILIIFAGNRGYLDEFDVSQIRQYETKLYAYFSENFTDLMQKIAKAKSIDADTDEALNSAFEKFNKTFKEEE